MGDEVQMNWLVQQKKSEENKQFRRTQGTGLTKEAPGDVAIDSGQKIWVCVLQKQQSYGKFPSYISLSTFLF